MAESISPAHHLATKTKTAKHKHKFPNTKIDQENKNKMLTTNQAMELQS